MQNVVINYYCAGTLIAMAKQANAAYHPRIGEKFRDPRGNTAIVVDVIYEFVGDLTKIDIMLKAV